MNKLNVAIIGHNFMGKAHSNAWKNAKYFFDVAAEPVLKVACGRDPRSLFEFASRWGWERCETDWKKAVHAPDVDIVDVAAPTYDKPISPNFQDGLATAKILDAALRSASNGCRLHVGA